MPAYVTNRGLIVADAPDPTWRLADNGIYILPAWPRVAFKGPTIEGPNNPTPAQGAANWRNLATQFTPQAGLEKTQEG